MAGKIHTPSRPLVPLRDIQYILSLLPNVSHSKSVPPYEPVHLKIDLQKKSRWEILKNKWKIERTLARLAQLEDQITKVDPNVSYLAYEVRGIEQVAQALETVSVEFARYESRIHTELKDRYPLIQLANPLQFENIDASTAPLALLIGDSIFDLSEDFHHQLETIAKTLSDPSRQTPLHIISKNLEIRNELHQVFMAHRDRDLNDEEFHLLVDAAEKFRGNPEDVRRHVFLDSVFYVDVDTNEPVWLIFYRALAAPPTSPKPPRPRKREKRNDSLLGIFAPRPLPIPVPVSVPVRNR